MTEKTAKPAYWAVLPATVRYDTVVPPNAKLLYAEISALCNNSGCCYASNEYFCELFSFTDRTVRRLLAALQEQGYIQIQTVSANDTPSGSGRLIFAGINPAANAPEGRTKMSGGADNFVRGGGQFCPALYKEVIEESNNTPLKPPQGGRERQKRAPRTAPDWKPERFAGFWAYYHRHEAKQKAMDAWDKLQPSDELISTMGRALVVLKGSDEWMRGIGIPYASTWLNGARWEDADGADWRDTYDRDVSRGWASDPEVI